MTKVEQLEQKLDHNDRIAISTLDKRSKNILPVCFLVIFFAHICIFFLLPKSLPVILVCCFSLLISFLVIRNTQKSLASAALKGDALILNTIDNKNCVTTLRSIRKIKTNKIGNRTITALHYNLDGTLKKAVLVSSYENTFESTPSEVIKSAQRYFKNKRQIYKPGSVS